MEKVLNEQGLTHLWSKIEDKIAAGGGGSSNPTAANVSFDNTGTGLQATNVQAALAEINTDLVGSEEVQGMITENLTGYMLPYSYTIGGPYSNASTIFTGTTNIFQRYRHPGTKIEYIYWDLDDVNYDNCTNKANILCGMNQDLMVLATGISYPNLKVQKGHYYRVLTRYYLSLDELYFQMRMLTVETGIQATPDSDSLRAKVMIMPGTRMYFFNTNSNILNDTYPSVDKVDSLGLTGKSFGYFFIEDVTPVVANGNEVSY